MRCCAHERGSDENCGFLLLLPVCDCGVSAAVQTVGKPGRNCGRQFYTRASGRHGCGFFEWKPDVSGASAAARPSQVPARWLMDNAPATRWSSFGRRRFCDDVSGKTAATREAGLLGRRRRPRPRTLVDAAGAPRGGLRRHRNADSPTSLHMRARRPYWRHAAGHRPERIASAASRVETCAPIRHTCAPLAARRRHEQARESPRTTARLSSFAGASRARARGQPHVASGTSSCTASAPRARPARARASTPVQTVRCARRGCSGRRRRYRPRASSSSAASPQRWREPSVSWHTTRREAAAAAIAPRERPTPPPGGRRAARAATARRGGAGAGGPPALARVPTRPTARRSAEGARAAGVGPRSSYRGCGGGAPA